MLSSPLPYVVYTFINVFDSEQKKGVDFLYNVQHDCPFAKCTASGKQPLMQERVASGVYQACIEHQPAERFVINTHAFHNAHLLRETLPRALVVPIPLLQDRKIKHIEMAVALRSTQEVKRTAARARAAQKKHDKKRPRLETEEEGLREGLE